MFIRNLKISDYEEIYKLWSHTEGMCMCGSADSIAAIENFITRNPGTCFVAEIAGRIAGVILGGHDGRNGSIYHLAVDTDYRSSGVGRALLNASTEALKKEGIHKITITVLKANEAGNKFWSSADFNENNEIVYREKSI